MKKVNIKNQKKIKKEIKKLIIQDANILTDMIYNAVVEYEVKDVKKVWERLLNSKVLDGAIHEVTAGFPGRR